MRAAAARMRNLIGDLLAYSRVSTRGQPFAPVDLTRAAHEVCLDLRSEQTGGRVEAGALATVEADPNQMRQLPRNLVGNALELHRPGVPPRVRVFAGPAEEPGDGRFSLAVEDEGISIEPKRFERIFLVFQRLHGRGEYEGTGVGLALCRRIVERRGGAIAVSSRPGEGTRFGATLPFRQPPAEGGRE